MSRTEGNYCLETKGCFSRAKENVQRLDKVSEGEGKQSRVMEVPMGESKTSRSWENIQRLGEVSRDKGICPGGRGSA